MSRMRMSAIIFHRARRLGEAGWIVAIWMLAFALRLAYVPLIGSERWVDEETYWEIASNYTEHGIYRSDRDLSLYGLEQVRPPLVPWMLAGLFRIVGRRLVPLRIVFALMSSLVVFPLHSFAARLGARPVACRIAALIGAAHPFLVMLGPRLLTESVFPVLVAASFSSLASWRERKSVLAPCATGVWLALAALCRPSLLPFTALLPFVWAVLGQGRRRWWGLVSALACGIVLVPWEVSLYARYGAWIPVTSSGAYNLWNANNPYMVPGIMATEVPPAMKQHLATLNEKERIRFYQQEAWRWARENPAAFWRARWIHFSGFWKMFPRDVWGQRFPFREAFLLPNPPSMVVVAGKIAWFATLNILLVAFLVEAMHLARRYPAEIASVLVALASLTLVHTLMTGYDRYRYPVDPIWMALGAMGVMRAIESTRTRLKKTRP